MIVILLEDLVTQLNAIFHLIYLPHDLFHLNVFIISISLSGISVLRNSRFYSRRTISRKSLKAKKAESFTLSAMLAPYAKQSVSHVFQVSKFCSHHCRPCLPCFVGKDSQLRCSPNFLLMFLSFIFTFQLSALKLRLHLLSLW